MRNGHITQTEPLANFLGSQERSPHHSFVEAAPPLYRLIHSRHITYTQPFFRPPKKATTVLSMPHHRFVDAAPLLYHLYAAVSVHDVHDVHDVDGLSCSCFKLCDGEVQHLRITAIQSLGQSSRRQKWLRQTFGRFSHASMYQNKIYFICKHHWR